MALHLFLDFDGTISQNDVGDAIVREFGAFEPLHSSLMAGGMSVGEYYHRAVESFSVSCTPESLSSFILKQDLDPGAAPLVAWAHQEKIPVHVVSDGFDVYIRPLLDRAGILEHVTSLHSNVLTWRGATFEASFPGASESCSCFCASCKRNAMLTAMGDDDVAIYVGDGRSDTCAVQFADVVFAKGTLAAYCTQMRIPHHPYRSLQEVRIILQKRFEKMDFAHRRQAILARKRAHEAE